MGDRMQSIAAIIFTLGFIAILATMNSSVIDFGTSVNNRLHQSYTDTETYELKVFDDTKVTGSTVISAINNRESIYTIPLRIELNGIDDVNSVSTTPGTTDYVNPTGSYSAKLLTNINGVVYGVSFSEILP